jgi:iron complex outermembrane receptor protein
VIVPYLLSIVLAAADPPAAPADTVLVLPEVRVERERVLGEARRRLPTAFVAEVATGASGRALESLSEALAEVAGVRVEQYGGLGAFSTVSLRGAPPGQVSVFLDGVPLTSAAHGVVNLADLPATAIERIEVYRGLAPLGLGVASPGGAINVVTVSAPELREARIARGAFGTWEARASVGSHHGDFAGFVHAGVQSSRGDFPYPDDNGTPFNAADDSTSRRVNAAFDAATVLGRLTWRPSPSLTVTGREDVFHRAQGVPGLGAVPAYRTHLDFLRSRSRLEVTRAGSGGTPGVRVSAGLDRERTRFRDPAAELGLGAHDSDDRLAGEDLRAELEWPRLAQALAFAMSGSLRGERARLGDAADAFPDPPESRRSGAGASAALQFRPFGDRLVLHAGERWDRIHDRLSWTEVAGVAGGSDVERTLSVPQIGVLWAPGGGIDLRANWTDAWRAPDFLELFGNQGSVLGNPALVPERGRNLDYGASWSGLLTQRYEARLECAHFESRDENLIVYLPHSQSSVRAENISRARNAGEEVSLHVRAPSGVAITGALTTLRSRDEGSVPFWYGRRLPQRPSWQGYGRLDWTSGRIRAMADVQAIGDNFLDRANLQSVPRRVLIGASLSLAVREVLRVTLEVKNLGDDHAVDVGGFPLPGRAVFASCDLRLRGAGDYSPRDRGAP